MAFEHSFMKPQIIKDDWWRVDDPSHGITYFPATHFTFRSVKDQFPELDDSDIGYLRGMYGARMSATGYMDCTDWSVFDTEEEARDYLETVYGEDDYGDTDDE